MAWSLENGKVRAPVLEVVVATQCNLTCRACSHLSPIAPKWLLDSEVLGRDLSSLARAFSCSVVKLIGGEPLLHPDIGAIAEVVHTSLPDASVHLVTNGLLFGRRFVDLQGIDQITVSLYPSVPLPDEARSALALAERAGLPVVFLDMPEFQEAYCERPHPDLSRVRSIYQACKVAHDWCCFTLRSGHFYKCPQADVLPAQLALPELGGARDNGVAIAESVSGERLVDRLVAYLGATDPLPACRACLGTSGKAFSHEVVARPQWRRLQDRDPAVMAINSV